MTKNAQIKSDVIDAKLLGLDTKVDSNVIAF